VPSERPQVMHSYTTLLFRLQLTASQLTVLQSVSWEQHHVTRFIGQLAATTAENIPCCCFASWSSTSTSSHRLLGKTAESIINRRLLEL